MKRLFSLFSTGVLFCCAALFFRAYKAHAWNPASVIGPYTLTQSMYGTNLEAPGPGNAQALMATMVTAQRSDGAKVVRMHDYTFNFDYRHITTLDGLDREINDRPGTMSTIRYTSDEVATKVLDTPNPSDCTKPKSYRGHRRSRVLRIISGSPAFSVYL